MSSTYPQDLPIAQGLEIVSIIRNGELAAKKAVFAYNVWLLQGFAQKTLLGDPGTPASTPPGGGVVLTPSAVPANFDAVGELEKLCLDAQSGAVTAQASVPWKQILLWALQELGTILAAAA